MLFWRPRSIVESRASEKGGGEEPCLKEEGLVTPQTHRLRLEALDRELINNLGADFRDAQKEGTRQRVTTGKVCEPTPEIGS